MRELTIDEMAEIRGGDSCNTATIVGGAFGVASFGFGAAALLAVASATIASGGTAVLLLGAGSFITGMPSAGAFIGSALAGCYGS
ncbi:MAG TPA: hypothetical protein VKA68_12460 [bacterium]|nr:hypothetical protein [bacterium]